MWNSNMIIHIEETDSFNEEIEEKYIQNKRKGEVWYKSGESMRVGRIRVKRKKSFKMITTYFWVMF